MMSRTMAEAQLPHRVDGPKLVENNQQFSAQIDSSVLSRLNDAVDRCLAPVSCVLSFDRDEERHRVLKGSCSTRVSMVCQRCLEPVEVRVESQFSLGLVFNDEQAKQLPRRLEPVEVDENGILDLWSVIEDEVLLALPMFPTHEASECQMRQPEPENKPGNEKRPNPFDVLAQLKQK
ncbi:YceD family protein [Parathalassolituus penaei]|uniref:Large ribosomal RNA subunit accumulation protein YceD n=1 Tax=Parathalassolituus penaei TaxID=2997323 RepID=A0A9X3IRY7_9GAMM|nr:YceD family protein [Parathalassolituus penaei]MCY0965346.1 YceD family protein [Parathalassolituus penaei]